MNVVCRNCKNKFYKHKSQCGRTKYHYCSRKCFYEFKKGKVRYCKFCKKEFYKGREHKGKAIFCSAKCLHESNKKLKEFVCKHCNKKFYERPSRNRKFCSSNCYLLYKKNTKILEKHKKKCRLCKTEFITNRKIAKFCSKDCSSHWLSNVRNKGRNHPRDKGNIKKRKKYPKEFFIKRKEIIQRDMGCYICNGVAYAVHHIDYNVKNNNSNNLVLLCNSCHAKTNTNRKFWKNFFTEEMRLIYNDNTE